MVVEQMTFVARRSGALKMSSEHTQVARNEIQSHKPDPGYETDSHSDEEGEKDGWGISLSALDRYEEDCCLLV
eukprot:CAMPEP_0198229358 /NCGR_PEP_ID=MMETSP1445-20131203/114082_1 /TAXON_ID=36898 /ORGANISM="Pyramimonas sp., Strain CCMP2087" /LENGTH=72 /DNA_ID=CAMNT_0043909815 /DNA_START=1444 /DNA_END=1658 /DNA_ORIENTATION=+